MKSKLVALTDLNKPPGLPESAYWSEGLALWIYQIVFMAVKDAMQEDRPKRGDPHVFDDYSPFNSRMTRRQREQKEKEDEG